MREIKEERGMKTHSCAQDIQIGDIVINKYNFLARGRFLKFRVTGFLILKRIRLVNGIRVKWDKGSNDWVSFGQEQTLHTCFRPDVEEINLLTR